MRSPHWRDGFTHRFTEALEEACYRAEAQEAHGTPPFVEDAHGLREHGLWGGALTAKVSSFVRRYQAWRSTRTASRLNAVAEVASGLWGSIADALNISGPYKEVSDVIVWVSGVATREGG